MDVAAVAVATLASCTGLPLLAAGTALPLLAVLLPVVMLPALALLALFSTLALASGGKCSASNGAKIEANSSAHSQSTFRPESYRHHASQLRTRGAPYYGSDPALLSARQKIPYSCR